MTVKEPSTEGISASRRFASRVAEVTRSRLWATRPLRRSGRSAANRRSAGRRVSTSGMLCWPRARTRRSPDASTSRVAISGGSARLLPRRFLYSVTDQVYDFVRLLDLVRSPPTPLRTSFALHIGGAARRTKRSWSLSVVRRALASSNSNSRPGFRVRSRRSGCVRTRSRLDAGRACPETIDDAHGLHELRRQELKSESPPPWWDDMQLRTFKQTIAHLRADCKMLSAQGLAFWVAARIADEPRASSERRSAADQELSAPLRTSQGLTHGGNTTHCGSTGPRRRIGDRPLWAPLSSLRTERVTVRDGGGRIRTSVG